MDYLILLLVLSTCLPIIFCDDDPSNYSDPNKDMYVINAMVYQIGIITNKTDDEAINDTLGNQEAITFYRTNGSHIDLRNLPTPLVTNVTAQNFVGVAPTNEDTQQLQKPLKAFDDLISLQPNLTVEKYNQSNKEMLTNKKEIMATIGNNGSNMNKRIDGFSETSLPNIFKRAIFSKTPVKIEKGSAEIPIHAGVQSIIIPPLLALNNSFSEIPVPIPNTSIVHYAKINTLFQTP
ncbi:uncharacterized protein ACR2FA_002619 [Aphomia sociella]